MLILEDDEIRRRASRIKLVLTDVDGTLTDTGVYYSARGEELKRYSIRDGMGIEMLRGVGVETAMITRESSGTVESRSKKLKLPYLFMGIWNKLEFLPELLAKTCLEPQQLAYFGDDVNDLEIMQEVSRLGLTGCPGDAMPVIAEISHFQARAFGGHGAFRDFSDWIMSVRA